MTDVNRRIDVISCAVMAEMSRFKEERNKHMKKALEIISSRIFGKNSRSTNVV